MPTNDDNRRIDRLYSRASHALRSPLSILALELGLIDDIRARRLEEDVAVFGESIRRSILLLGMYAGDFEELGDINVDALLTETVEEAAMLCSTKQLEVELSNEGPPTWSGYATVLRESLRCLIENAITHTPEAGRIRIAWTADADLSVEDSGPGIPPDIAHRTREPFVGSPANGMGVGVGLAFADATAQLHGSTLSIARSDLGGAKVTLGLAGSSQGELAQSS